MSLLRLLPGLALALAAAPALAQAPPPPPAAYTPAGGGACDKPVYLVVWVDHLDRAKSKAYGEGLRSTHIVPRHGGRYLAVSPPVKVLEGDWPADRAVVVEEYPCLAAATDMWFSDEYQKTLKPLREGSGDYKVALFQKFTALPPAKP